MSRKAPAQALGGNGAMLKSAFGKHRHFQTGHSLDATRDDLAFERIKSLNRHGGQRCERNSFGDFDYAGSRKRTEAVEPVVPRRRVGAQVAATQSSAIG